MALALCVLPERIAPPMGDRDGCRERDEAEDEGARDPALGRQARRHDAGGHDDRGGDLDAEIRELRARVEELAERPER